MSNRTIYPDDTDKMLSGAVANVHTVAGALGGPLDVGCLCSDKRKMGNDFVDKIRINPKSFEKPVRLDKVGFLTQADYESVNYGWEIPTYPSVAKLLYNIAEGVTWGYLKPRGLAFNEPQRIDDFRSYYHSAPSPLEITFPDGSRYSEFGTNDDVLLKVRGKDLLNPATGSGFWGWGHFGTNNNPLDYAIGIYVVYADCGPMDPFEFTNPNATGIKWCMVVGNPNQGGMPTMSNIGTQSGYDLKIPKSYLGVGNGFADGPYFLVPFITTVTVPDVIGTQEKTDGSGTFMPFFSAPLRMRLNYVESTDPVDNIEISEVAIYGKVTGGTYNRYIELETGAEYGSAKMRILNGTDQSMTGAKATLIIGEGDDIAYTDTTNTIPANGSFVYNFNLKDYADYPIIKNLQATVRVHLQWGGNSRTYNLGVITQYLQSSPGAL